jgi:hypothetical protein
MSRTMPHLGLYEHDNAQRTPTIAIQIQLVKAAAACLRINQPRPTLGWAYGLRRRNDT